MKRFLYLFVALVFFFGFSVNVQAKTLKDLKNTLAELEKKKASNEKTKNLTKNEMNTINNRISNISSEITKSEKKIQELNDEIVDLEKKSEEKESEIKDVIAFLQVTNSNNAYLEYMFGAQSITDLIFRSAISEQLVSYNNDLIEEYTKTVKECNAKKEDLQVEIVNLDNEQTNLKSELVKLGDKLDDIV